MTNCPHCNAELPIETLASAGEPVCPSCGRPIDLSEEDGNLSSLAGGSPADATIQLGSDSDSSSTDLSLDESAAFSDEASSADSSLDMTIDSGDLSAINRDANEGADDDTDFDATLVYGDRPDQDDDDDLEDDDPEQGFLLEDDPEGPSESLDATIDFGRLEASAKARREDDATVGPEGLAGLGAAGDLTRMLDDSVPANQANDAGELTTDSAQLPNEGGGSPAADSEAPGSQEPTPTGDETERGGSSAFSDSSLERSDLPSDSADDATLQFDSDIRSGNVNTPEALDITGLGSEDTLPRGPLGQGRASASLRPGESMIVGDESVRLRAFELSEADPTGAREIDYKIEGEAGKGGMGVVYKARQQSLDRLVAIKQIKSEMGASESDRNKFVSEAVITGQLEHPNIAPVHDLGLAADGLPFYAMKFVDGDDWEDTIKGLSEEENLAILIQVAQAIAFAHSRNILHRDLKPGNVRLGSFGEVLVMDWGLAARLDDGSEIQPAGTPIYMPPETALEYLDYAKGKVVGGNRIGSSRRRVPAGMYCDIYLLGALLFKIVTGRAPHRGKTTFECLRAAAKNDIVKVRRSSELLDIAYRAMATEPEDRYTSALDFIEAIRAYQSHAQSILIAKRASTDLRQAGRLVDSENPDATQLYALFSSAQNGYQNALDLWEGNRKAARRLKKSQRMFAEAAYANGDYDLALSLLDDPNEEDASLRRSIVGSQKSRNARLTWFKTLQYATAASLVLALSFIAYSVVAKLDAISARAEAIAEADKATIAKADAERAKTEAIRSEQLAADAAAKAAEETGRAAAAQAEALAAGREAAESKQDAAQAIAAAEQAEALLTIAERNARQAAEKAKQQSYLAAFGQIRATLSDSGSYAAWKVMQRVDPTVAAIGSDRPEWQFLMKAIDWRDEATELVGEDPAQLSRPTLIATSSNAEWLVAATKAGNAIVCSVYRGGDRVSVQKFDVPGVLNQVAIDSSGRYIAFAGSELRVLDRSTGEALPAQTLPKAVTCLAFHPTQSELLFGTRSTAIERWTIDTGRLARLESDAQWHRTGVTAVGYSADGTQRFSADDSGRLVVWRLRDGAWSDRKTIAHSGAGSPRITAAALADSPSGRLAYGCDDGAVYEGFGWWENDSPSSNPDGGLAETAFERLNTYHPSAVTSIGYAIGGSTILSSGGDTLLVRRSPTLTSAIAAGLKTLETERRYHDAKVLACGAGRDGFAYSSDERGRVLRWQIEASPSEITLQPAEGNSGVAAVQLSPAGNQLAVADQAGFVRTWSDLSKAQASSTAYVGHADHRDLAAWHLEGRPDRLVTIAADNRACVWRAEDGLLERTIDLGGRTVVAVDPTRRMLYAVSDGRLVDGSSAVAWPIDGGVRRDLWDSNARVAAIHPLGGDKQSLAVGLRDGQVALWQSDVGRIELVRSSGRPHWRPISAFAYDPASGRLYSGDTGGLVAAWDLADGAELIERLLSDDVQTGPAAIARIELASGKRLLVVQRSDQAVIPSLLRTDLSSVADSSLATPTLLDAAFDPASDSVVGIRRSGNQREFVAWEPDRGWRPIGQLINDPVAKLRTSSDGWLAWGGNRVQWNSRRGEMSPLSVTSRPRTEAFLASDNETVQAITASGSVTQWDAPEHLLRQRAIPYAGTLLASCEGALADQVVLAIAQAGDGCRIELWSTASNKRWSVLAKLPEPAKKLVRSADRVIAVAHDQITLLSLDGEAPESIKLPTGVGRAVSVAWDPNSQRLAIATAPGRAFLAERLGDRRWQLMPIDREDVSSIAFTPDGDRLLVGVESGRVLMLSLETASEGVQATRSVLSLPGHGNRVTLIEVAQTAEGAQIVSGDASGRVVVRSL